ncbi:MAG TPA: MSMEG_0569 family flavin-dependent oxidoreductase [Solirubrobacteraceae bacterium]|jgi:putative flavoprotein involved in K+ transport|nr:MSMEG_0569 family flavin-dependent oxidoreductase [Solirubrobacteraceae bacterium]
MPSVEFTLRWPDGAVERCYSPSRAIEQVLVPGGVYPVAELVRRCQAGLERASERVREQRGFACTAAAEQLAAIEGRAGGFATGSVRVEGLRREEPPPSSPAPERLSGHAGAIVIGGGQAGLAVSYHLRERSVPHVVLERDCLASSWRKHRWDTFCLVTPNWQCRLPGYPYRGDDPDGFMVREEIVAYVEGFASSFHPPLYEGVTVERVEDDEEEGFRVHTSHGELTAEQVILAVGGYHVPALPPVAAALGPEVTQLHSSSYRNPSSLPDGAVLVVGSGQSGAQIAEDLHLAGREVHLSVGSAPRVARFYRGRDCVAWLEDMGHYDMPIEEHPEGLAARKEPNHYVTGRDGGHDLDLRAMAREGMHVHGRLLGVEGSELAFADDLASNLDSADATAERIKDAIDRYIGARGIEAPTEPRYSPVWEPEAGAAERLSLGLEGLSTVVWATGFRSDWSWVKVPAFDGSGYPVHRRGVTTVPGLYVLGLPWLHTWGSGRFAGIDRDACHVAEHVTEYRTVEAQAAA